MISRRGRVHELATGWELVLPPELEYHRLDLDRRARAVVSEFMARLDWLEYLPLLRLRFEVTASVPLSFRWGLVGEAGVLVPVEDGALPCSPRRPAPVAR